MNQIMLLGNLGSDPELRYTQANKAVLKISLGTSERWRDQQGNRQEATTWHQVIFWEKRAEAPSKILRKGSKVLVRGKISNRSYEKDGQKQYISEVRGEDLELCDRAQQGQQQQQPVQQQPVQQQPVQQQPVQQQPVQQQQQPVQQQPVQQQQQQPAYPGTGIPLAQNNGNPPQAANHRNPNQSTPPLGVQNQQPTFAPNTNQHPDPAPTAPGLDDIPF